MSNETRSLTTSINYLVNNNKPDVVRIMNQNGYQNVSENMSNETISNRLISAMAQDVQLSQNIVDFMRSITSVKSFGDLAGSAAVTAGIAALGTLGTAWSNASQAKQAAEVEKEKQRQKTNRAILIGAASFLILFVGTVMFFAFNRRKMARNG